MPCSGDDSPPPLDNVEEWQAMEEEAEEGGSEETTAMAARAKAEADAKAKAKDKAQPATTRRTQVSPTRRPTPPLRKR
jgi:hypothetical protein